VAEKRSYREELMKGVGKKAYDSVTKSYDVLGDIAIVDGSAKDAKKIGKAVMAVNSNIKTVVRKGGAVSGKYRTRSYLPVMGKKNYIATYRENGAVFKFDIRKTFFSSRLGFERKRISDLINKKENVMVMFAGVGPFAIEIAKAHKDSTVIGAELNAYACKSMKENILLNNVKNVKVEEGDVKTISKKYKRFSDRIIMPLPKESYKFLDSVNTTARKGCVVHYYAFGDRDDPYSKQIKSLKEFFAAKGRSIKVIGKRVARPYSPKEVEVAIDFTLN
jgi:tRNA (guanine37-N1)-methyltransferase